MVPIGKSGKAANRSRHWSINWRRCTSKGQITVPHEIRRALGVRPGDKLPLERDGGRVRVRRVRPKSPFEKYRGIAGPAIRCGKKAVARWVHDLRGR